MKHQPNKSFSFREREAYVIRVINPDPPDAKWIGKGLTITNDMWSAALFENLESAEHYIKYTLTSLHYNPQRKFSAQKVWLTIEERHR